MDATKFYTEDKFGLFIDLHSMRDQGMHGSGLRMVNTKDGVMLKINRKTLSTDSVVNCNIFIIAHAQMAIMNKVLESVTYRRKKYRDVQYLRSAKKRIPAIFRSTRLL
jgi:hypothetical protein